MESKKAGTKRAAKNLIGLIALGGVATTFGIVPMVLVAHAANNEKLKKGLRNAADTVGTAYRGALEAVKAQREGSDESSE